MYRVYVLLIHTVYVFVADVNLNMGNDSESDENLPLAQYKIKTTGKDNTSQTSRKLQNYQNCNMMKI